ncbi:MAG: hypothetical protein HKP44_01740, partial [Desulfofustis sp.]|nr:hypothetical protein [Desulfofustis sp.]
MLLSPVKCRLSWALSFSVLFMVLSVLLPFPLLPQVEPKNEALVLSIDGTINPAVSDYIKKGLLLAAEQNTGLVIIRMNTPGGLDA